MSEKITLSGVPETMLQTVYARAKETKTRGAITDNKAVEIIDRLDYDFSMADKDAAMHSGVIARTIVLDKLVKTYLAGHGGAVVVNIACGLDTRCYRMSDYSQQKDLADHHVRDGRLGRRDQGDEHGRPRHHRGLDDVLIGERRQAHLRRHRGAL